MSLQQTLTYAVQGYFSHAATVPPSANQHAASDICRDTGQAPGQPAILSDAARVH